MINLPVVLLENQSRLKTQEILKINQLLMEEKGINCSSGMILKTEYRHISILRPELFDRATLKT